MDGGPDRGNPNRKANDLGNVVSEPRAAAKAHQDGDPNLGSKSPVAERASGKQTEAWNEAPGLAKNLELLGVSPQQFYALLDALLPRGWDSETGIVLGNDESIWRLRELGLLASATAVSLVLGKVARTDASQARPLQQAAKPTLCRNRCGRLANASDVTCCHTCHKGHHTAQCLDRHLSSQDWESHANERCSAVHDDQELAFHTNSHEKRSAAAGEVQLQGGFGKKNRETSGPGEDTALDHTHMVDFVLLPQPRVTERGFSIANRAVERTMNLHWKVTNARSAFVIDTLLSLPLHFR